MGQDFTIKVVQAWWLQPYFYYLAAFCALTGCEPDEEKLKAIIDRALEMKIVWE